jgi:hypothetical protein
VDAVAYLLTLCRYLECNPLAAATLGEWTWSSYRAHADGIPAPNWLDTDHLLGYLADIPTFDAVSRQGAALVYCALVHDNCRDEADAKRWQVALRHRVYLGGDEFVNRTQARSLHQKCLASDVPKAQCMAPITNEQCMSKCPNQAAAMHIVCREGGMTMTPSPSKQGYPCRA